jgi:hypothetical protein
MPEDENGRADAASGWLDSANARAYVTRLIRESGVPLEASLSRLCHRFVTVWDDTKGCRIASDPLVYGVDRDRPLREIDQLVTFYRDIPVTDRLGVQLILSAPIEAKARRQVELFGLEVSGQEVGAGALPIAGELAHSSFVRNDVAAHVPAHMKAQRIQRVAALKFKDDTPQSVHEEKLVNNATGALYDFIMESTAPEGLSPLTEAHRSESDPILAALLGEFDEYVRVNHFLAEHVVRRWVSQVPDDRVKEYVASITGGRRVYRMLDIYCPVLCIDQPMHLVEVDGFGEIVDFAATEALTTSVRIAGWHTGPGQRLSRRGPEAVVSLMTLRGVEDLLIDLLHLFHTIAAQIGELSSEAADRAIFEHDFVSAVVDRSQNDSNYRSDLDMGGL